MTPRTIPSPREHDRGPPYQDRPRPRRARIPTRRDDLELALRLTDRPEAPIQTIELPPGQITLLEMGRGFQTLRHRLVIDCAISGRSVLQLVSAAEGAVLTGRGDARAVAIGHRLDSTRLARKALACGLDPAYVLRASVLARAFTAYQLSTLVHATLPETLATTDHHALVIATDPLSLYTEEDVPRREGLALAEQATDALAQAACDHRMPVLVVQPPMGGSTFMAPLYEQAGQHVRIRPHPDQGLIVHRAGHDPVHLVTDPGRGQATLADFGLEAPGQATDPPVPDLAPTRVQPRHQDASWSKARPVIAQEGPDG